MQKVKHFQILPVRTIHNWDIHSQDAFHPSSKNYLQSFSLIFSKSLIFCVWFPSVWVRMYVHAGRWWRGVSLQSGWWSHTIHWLDPAGGVLPGKPWGAALQAKAPLCPDHPVNKGPKRPLTVHVHLNSRAFLAKHSQCSCALKKKDIHNNSTAMLTETTVRPLSNCGTWSVFCSVLFVCLFSEKAEFDNRLYGNWLQALRMMYSFVQWTLYFGPVMCLYVAVKSIVQSTNMASCLYIVKLNVYRKQLMILTSQCQWNKMFFFSW